MQAQVGGKVGASDDAVTFQLPDGVSVSPAEVDPDGFFRHVVQSPYQAGPTGLRVLLPDKLSDKKRLPVVYVLPVEAGCQARYGDGLLEVRKHNLQNRHQAVFVAPTFAELPWYADHPTRPQRRQETYFLQVVVPAVEQAYGVSAQAEDRLLLGFSKSGWGAWSLLLRHLDAFGRAAAWDAPLLMTQVGQYGNGPIFGTQENFEQYQPAELLRQNAESLAGQNRLVLTGHGNFAEQHRQIHQRMLAWHIPHVYRDGPQRKHDWHSGWVSEAVELLFANHAK